VCPERPISDGGALDMNSTQILLIVLLILLILIVVGAI
jgi:hypothetical protein